MSSTKIKLNGNEIETESGLVKVEFLYAAAGIKPDSQWLYLNKEKDIDVPLLPNEYIIIHGEENIFSGDVSPDIGENPNVRIPVCPQFNGGRLELSAGKAKISGGELRKYDTALSKSKLFVDLSGQVDVFIEDEFVLVIQSSDCYFTAPIDSNEDIDLEECAKADRKPPKGQKAYKIKVDREKLRVDKHIIEGREILALVNKIPDGWRLDQKLRGGRRKRIESDEMVDLSLPGVERFETVMKQAQQGKDV